MKVKRGQWASMAQLCWLCKCKENGGFKINPPNQPNCTACQLVRPIPRLDSLQAFEERSKA